MGEWGIWYWVPAMSKLARHGFNGNGLGMGNTEDNYRIMDAVGENNGCRENDYGNTAGAVGGMEMGMGETTKFCNWRNMVQELKMELRSVKTSRKTIKGINGMIMDVKGINGPIMDIKGINGPTMDVTGSYGINEEVNELRNDVREIKLELLRTIKMLKTRKFADVNSSVEIVVKTRGNGRGRGRNWNKSVKVESRSKSSGSGSSEERNNNNDSKKTCYFCKKEGHLKRDCYKWKAAVKSIEYETTSEGDTDISMVPHVGSYSSFGVYGVRPAPRVTIQNGSKRWRSEAKHGSIAGYWRGCDRRSWENSRGNGLDFNRKWRRNSIKFRQWRRFRMLYKKENAIGIQREVDVGRMLRFKQCRRELFVMECESKIGNNPL